MEEAASFGGKHSACCCLPPSSSDPSSGTTCLAAAVGLAEASALQDDVGHVVLRTHRDDQVTERGPKGGRVGAGARSMLVLPVEQMLA